MEEKTVKTVFALIKRADKVLLIQEGHMPAYGQWCFPGGHVDAGETLEQAVCREALEESDVEVRIKKLIGKRKMTSEEYKGDPNRDQNKLLEVYVYECEIDEGQVPRKGTEELGIGWFSSTDLRSLPLRWKWIADLSQLNVEINHMEETKVKCGCGMPLTVDSECECKPSVCIYCCECPEGCVCNCKVKAAQTA